MRRLFCIVVAIAAAAALFVPTATAKAMPYFEDATVIGDEVNMRMRPTTESPVIMKLAQGDRIGVFCEETEGWYRIIYGNYRGYISADYVFLPSRDQLIGHVLQAGLNVRQNPGSYSGVVGTLNEGTGVTITNISGEWYYIEADTLEELEEADEAQSEEAVLDEDEDAEGDLAILRGYVHRDFVELSSAKTASTLLKPGMSGALVRNVQQNLRKRGFLMASATGFYGEMTESAVKEFQKKAGIKDDGIIGQRTYEILFSDADISVTRAERHGIRGPIRMTEWNSVKNVFTRGSRAVVTDVRSGRKFTVRRHGGTLHADVEPASADDTATMKRIIGGSWSWSRRPIWVTVGSRTYAASMNGMPHGGASIGGNNFNGHFCIHFKDSRTHTGNAQCRMHQAAVRYAFEKGQ